jgi:hypothetical protein
MVRRGSTAGAEILAKHAGVGRSTTVLIAGCAMEAVELWSFCGILQAESVLINGNDVGRAVDFAVRLKPVLFVYDTRVISPRSIRAIGAALKGIGQDCSMLAVTDKVDPSHGQYSAIFGNHLASCSLSDQDVTARACGTRQDRSILSDAAEHERSSSRVPQVTPSPSATSESSQPWLTLDAQPNSKKQDIKRESDIFAEFGTAVVGFFAGTPTAPPPPSTPTTHGQNSTEAHFDTEVEKRTHSGSDGKALLSL